MKAPQTCITCGKTFYKGAWMWLYPVRRQQVHIALDGKVSRSVVTSSVLECLRCGR